MSCVEMFVALRWKLDMEKSPQGARVSILNPGRSARNDAGVREKELGGYWRMGRVRPCWGSHSNCWSVWKLSGRLLAARSCSSRAASFWAATVRVQSKPWPRGRSPVRCALPRPL